MRIIAVAALVLAVFPGQAQAASGYRITTGEDLCLASTDGRTLRLVPFATGPCGSWNGTANGEIKHLRTGRCLVLDNTKPYLATCDGTIYQKWTYKGFAYNWGKDWTEIRTQATNAWSKAACVGYVYSGSAAGVVPSPCGTNRDAHNLWQLHR
ncbi:hypothetical protein ACIBG8_13040 [Nonomuraea sp. NPDC050556]|uniref:hypothetical protein n=1 Tax=Nonomuraea sp. NPDC050556 TaxID=3364369 RepID=UPI0037A35718